MTQTKSRKLNIELLRIVCIFGISIPHYLYWNDAILLATNDVTPLRIIGSVIEALCNPSLACYVMISGYCDRSTEFRPGRVLRLLAQVWFWSVLLHLICAAAGIVPLAESVWDLATYFLPIMSGHYWFATAFVVMEIFVPLLNAAAERVSRQTLRNVILALLIYESVIKTVVPFQLNQDAMGYDFGFFLMVFLIGAYLRTYGIPKPLNGLRKALAGYFAGSGVAALVQITASVLHARTGSFSWLMSTPFHLNFLFTLSASVCLFLAFAQWEMGQGTPAAAKGVSSGSDVAAAQRASDTAARGERLPERWIRKLAPLTFGVYLISCHTDLISRWPVRLAELAGMDAGTSGILEFYLWMLVSVGIVIAVCAALDAVRKLLFDAVLNRSRPARRK